MKIENNRIKNSYLKNGIIFTLLLIFSLFISYNVLSRWHNRTVARNSTLCSASARQLLLVSKNEMNRIGDQGLFNVLEFSNTQFTQIDNTLSLITERVLSEHQGLEGGFYFSNLDKFLGYGYPTSNPPKPVYGPPPRSFNIIREQCLKSIIYESYYLELHGFDPAVFPLITIPVLYKNEIIGTIWVRIHIERELPLIKLQNVINIAALLLIIILLFVLYFIHRIRANILSIRVQLEKVNENPNYRLHHRGKMFSEIVNSINSSLVKLEKGNKHRQSLEFKLLQREKMASIGRIVAGVAHEVRTPLAIIKTRIQIWQQLLKEQKQDQFELITKEAMDLVVNETNRLSDLIKRLLIFSRPINKKMTNTNIVEQINETIKILQIQKNNSSIIFNVIDEGAVSIEVDSNSTQQVFINVIGNAMEAMPDDGNITICIKLNDNKNALIIEIIDEGEGIPEHIIGKMFELFTTSKPSGVGLGLSISHEIVKAHNGEIFYENLDKGGAKCTILFPIKQQSA